MKRRFGVSLPEPVASRLDELALTSNSDRSTIVTKALEEYLHDDLHDYGEHVCAGLIISISEKPVSASSLESSGVVRAQFTVKSSAGYVTVLYVEGLYEHVKRLRHELSRKCRFTRYIPISCVYRGGSRSGPA
ncbi:MAG: CopG family ribbon-helix-helix protein [Desulfurococcaceae archaeon]